jgi:hypothetical protein
MAALYDLKPNDAIVAALAAVIETADDEAAPDERQKSESYKIGVAPLRQKLGLASKWTARERINKLVDLGALEEDEAKLGKGRGSPHFYRIRKETLEEVAGNVFPTVEAVREIVEGGGVGQPRPTKGQPIDIVGTTCLSGQLYEDKQKPSENDDISENKEASCPSSYNRPDKQDSPYNSKTYPVLRSDSDTPPPSSNENGAEKPGNAQKSGALTASERIAAAREAGGKLTVWADGTGFDVDARAVSDPLIRDLLLASIDAGYGAILAELKRERGGDPAGAVVEEGEL